MGSGDGRQDGGKPPGPTQRALSRTTCCDETSETVGPFRRFCVPGAARWREYVSGQAILWVAFHLLVAGMITLDLGVLTRTARALTTRQAGALSLAWILLALLFGAGIWSLRGPQDGLAFLTGYILEKALSVDNTLVIALIFRELAVPPHLQPKVLKWGILGALVMRAAFVIAGVTLLHAAHWVVYVFGALIIWAGLRMLRPPRAHTTPAPMPILHMLRRWIPPGPPGAAPSSEAFVSRRGGRVYGTPLLLALVTVEVTDLVFAADSVPAILAVTADPFLAYTSNVFAVLGLRAMYFLLAGVMGLFRYLEMGLAVVLVLVGLKMLASGVYQVPIGMMLSVVGAILAVSVIASLLHHRPGEAA